MVIVAVFAVKWYSSHFNHYRLVVQMDKSNNMAAGNNVSLRGVVVGEVESVRLNDSKVSATIRIKKEIRIPIGSKFRIENVGLFGEKNIAIFPSESTEYYKANSVVTSESSVASAADLGKAVGSLITAAEAIEINRKLDSIISILNKNKSTTRQ